MPDHAFLFSVRLPGARGFDAMLADLTSNVLSHLGFAPAAIDELSGELRAGLPPVRADEAGPEVDVRFQARDGEIEIAVSHNERRVMCVSRRIP